MEMSIGALVVIVGKG